MGKRPSKLKRACLRCWPVLRFRVLGRGVARWKRYCVRALIGLPLVLVATVVIVTQTPIMGNLLLPRMSAALGMGIKAGGVYVAAAGREVFGGRKVPARSDPEPGLALGPLSPVGGDR